MSDPRIIAAALEAFTASVMTVLVADPGAELDLYHIVGKAMKECRPRLPTTPIYRDEKEGGDDDLVLPEKTVDLPSRGRSLVFTPNAEKENKQRFEEIIRLARDQSGSRRSTAAAGETSPSARAASKKKGDGVGAIVTPTGSVRK